MSAVSINHHMPPAVVHVDLDGAGDIFKSHGWTYPGRGIDPIFLTGLRNALDFFERNGIKATLFTIANSLDEPSRLDLIREALARGHEIASHTLTHAILTQVDSERKRYEIAESREKLEKLLSVTVRGFRAPGYLLDREAIMLLGHYGYSYDSSAFPTRNHSRRLNVPLSELQFPSRPFQNSKLIELPLPNHHPSPLPFNPSYSLLFGMKYFYWSLKRFRRRGAPLVLLFHLVDLADPLPEKNLRGFKSRVFTLSMMSREYKLSKCQKMLDLVRGHFRITTTSELLATII